MYNDTDNYSEMISGTFINYIYCVSYKKYLHDSRTVVNLCNGELNLQNFVFRK